MHANTPPPLIAPPPTRARGALRAASVAGLADVLRAVLPSCDGVRLLRPPGLRQRNTHVVRLTTELPEADEPNKAIITRRLPHGGLAHAGVGTAGAVRAAIGVRPEIGVPAGQRVWGPSTIAMPRAGDLEREVQNEGHNSRLAFLRSTGARRIAELPTREGSLP